MKTALLYLTIVLTLFCGCKERFSPKPTGYLRIDLNEKIDIFRIIFEFKLKDSIKDVFPF